jgi:hypothetical protein
MRPTRESREARLFRRTHAPDSLLFGLTPGGVYQAAIVTNGTGELLPHLFTLTVHKSGVGGIFSVALSLESLPLGVTQHPASWSSDFPHAPHGRARPSVLLDPFVGKPPPGSCSGALPFTKIHARGREGKECDSGVQLAVEGVVGELIRRFCFAPGHVLDIDAGEA